MLQLMGNVRRLFFLNALHTNDVGFPSNFHPLNTLLGMSLLEVG